MENSTFTIDLNGRTWQSSQWVMVIGGNAKVTITDSTSEGNGKLCGTGEGCPTITFNKKDAGAELSIEGGTVEHSAGQIVIK